MKINKSIETRELLYLFIEKNKKAYYSNLHEKRMTDNKKFWKTVTQFLSDKNLSNERISLIEKFIKIINIELLILLTMIPRQPI